MNRYLTLKAKAEAQSLSHSRKVPPISNPSEPPHKYTPLATPKQAKGVPKPTYGLDFTDYDETIAFLSNLKPFPELRAQVFAQLHSGWRPAIKAALQEFWERLRCRECGQVPGKGIHKGLGEEAKTKLDDLIGEMSWVDVGVLDEKRVLQFQRRLRVTEIEFLEANVELEREFGGGCKKTKRKGATNRR